MGEEATAAAVQAKMNEWRGVGGVAEEEEGYDITYSEYKHDGEVGGDCC